MPREIPKPYPQPGPKPAPRPNPDQSGCCPLPPPKPRPQSDETDLKIKSLAENIAKLYLPYALKDTASIEEISIEDLANDAYIYIDNNGKPTKLVFKTVVHTQVEWDDLSEEVKEQILKNHLTPGEHITISPDGVISADVGVESINGQTGDVVLTAEDLNVYNKTEVYTKNETNTVIEEALDNAIETLDITIDGGLIQ